MKVIFNPFYTNGFFLYPLRTLENQKFSDAFGLGGIKKTSGII